MTLFTTPRFSTKKPLLLVFLVLAGAFALYAQNSRGTILGHIGDASGAAEQGAKVRAANVNTFEVNNFVTTAVGDYVFVDLVPGTYEVSVGASGFKAEKISGLVLEVEQPLRQDF